jgi:hypothetical protein
VMHPPRNLDQAIAQRVQHSQALFDRTTKYLTGKYPR